MGWNRSVIRDHKEAAERLTRIAHAAFAYLREHTHATEGETKGFILREIVAFGNSSVDPHYRPVPGSRKLKPGTLVMIDVWGRLRGRHMPYADITWMGYCAGPGLKVPREPQKVFDAVIAARDACLKLVRRGAARNALPIGKIADEAANKVIRGRGYGKHIKHGTGHILGFSSPHGRGRHLNRKNGHPLLKGFGYTIEPGIYIKGKFGVRSEMNFYADSSGKVVVTTPLQRRLVMI
jgi:Xaa-Pro aminopeptidase